MSPKKILPIALVAIGIAIRVFVIGGDDEPATPAVPTATPGVVPAQAGAPAATQPVAQTGGTAAPAPAPAAAAAPEKKLPKQSEVFPARFEKRVLKLCNRYENLIDTTASAKGVDRFEKLRRLIRTTEDAATDYEQLEPPARNQKAWTRYADFYRDASDLFGRIESEIADQDKPSFDRYVAQSRKLGGQAERLNARYGFAGCDND